MRRQNCGFTKVERLKKLTIHLRLQDWHPTFDISILPLQNLLTSAPKKQQSKSTEIRMGFPCYQSPEIKYTMKVQISCPTWLNQVFLCISKYLGSLHKKTKEKFTHFYQGPNQRNLWCFRPLFSQSSNLPATKRLHTTASFNSLWLTWNSRDSNRMSFTNSPPVLRFHKSKQRKPREGVFFHGHDFETWNACNIRKEKINRNKKNEFTRTRVSSSFKYKLSSQIAKMSICVAFCGQILYS